MSVLPHDSFLGNLEIIETYVFYDCPRLFTCQNTCGQFFLAVWLEDTDDGDLWLYVNLSPQRLAMVHTGQIDLYEAFRDAETRWVFHVTTYYDERPSKIEEVRCDTLDDDWLPKRGQRLSGVAHPELTASKASKETLEQLFTEVRSPKRSFVRAKLRFGLLVSDFMEIFYMVQHAIIPTLTESEYLEWEAHRKIRHEYVDGHIFAMSGTTKKHNRIAGNLYSLILSQIRGTHCQVYLSDVKLNIPHKQTYYYPDVMVGCDPTDDESDHYLSRPCLLIEVLSSSTKQVDRREKLLAYQTLASVQEYVLVSQHQRRIEVYWRDAQGPWRKDIYQEEDDQIYFRCLDLQVRLAEIYEGVSTLKVVSSSS